MFAAINAMLLDMLAAVARKDYEDRRRRQAQGIAKARAEGAYRGRPEDTARNAGIASMLRSGLSWTAIQAATGCSRATIAKMASGPLRSALTRLRERRIANVGAAQMLACHERLRLDVRARLALIGLVDDGLGICVRGEPICRSRRTGTGAAMLGGRLLHRQFLRGAEAS